MSSIAITMMSISLIVIWGGLLYAINRLPNENE